MNLHRYILTKGFPSDSVETKGWTTKEWGAGYGLSEAHRFAVGDRGWAQ